MSEPFPLPLFFRGFPEPGPASRRPPPVLRPHRWVLIVDVETTTDTAQRLLFGGYQICRVRREGSLVVAEHGLFFDEGPQGLSREQAHMVRQWIASRIEATAGRRPRYRLRTRAEFVHDVLLHWAGTQGALVVGLNLAFDLARLADGFGVARRGIMAGGFSLILPPHPASLVSGCPWKPRLRVKLLGERRALFAISSKGLAPGRFLDLRTLMSALTGESYSLDRAAEHYGIPYRKPDEVHHGIVTAEYLDYHANDLDMTRLVCERACAELASHPIGLVPDKALSSAALGRGYLAAMGIRPALGRSIPASHRIHGIAMEAYYGGRAETRVRGVAVPVIPVDFRSQYPTVNVLLNLWPLMTADRLAVEDCTTDARQLLAAVDRAWLLDPAHWPHLQFFAKIQPRGDILPVRAPYGGNRVPGIGVNHLTPGPAQWVAGPDLAASMLLTGAPAEILEAVTMRVEPPGRDLRPVRFRGRIPLDPRRPDFFAHLVEERERLKRDGDADGLATGLKLFTNATAYGITVQFNPRTPHHGDAPGHLWCGDVRHERPDGVDEEPGPYCLPAVGALTTAGGRLLLAMLEHEVTRRGGTFATCDTDGMAIVAATERRSVAAGDSTVVALGADEVRAIVDAFRSLNPFRGPLAGESILKIEYPEWLGQVQALSISAKRYVLFRLDVDGRIHIVKPSDHGLGHLLPPVPRERWLDEVWRYGIARALGLNATIPSWWDAPALMRLTVTQPSVVPEQAFAQHHLLPMSFVLTPVLDHVSGGYAVGDAVRLVHPYVDPVPPLSTMRWLDLHTGESCIAGIDVEPGLGVVAIKSLGQVIEEHLHKPEAKSGDARGDRCTRRTTGLLTRLHVQPTGRTYIGKEVSGYALTVETPDGGPARVFASAGTAADWRRRLAAVPSLKQFARDTGIDVRTLRRAKNRDRTPSPAVLKKILAGLMAFPTP